MSKMKKQTLGTHDCCDPATPRILVADDEPAIIEFFKTVFSPDSALKNPSAEFAALDRDLFGAEVPEQPRHAFEITACRQATEAVAAVEAALAQNQPFAVAFLDVRMPPGPDGIWAAQRIRALDPRIEIVIATGYADVDPRLIAQRVPPAHKLLYLQKPCHLQEVFHFAFALYAKWEAECLLQRHQENLSRTIEMRTRQLRHLNTKLQQDIERQTKSEEEKSLLEARLRQSHKMEAIGTLAGGIAHDFNNILSAIIGYTELALDPSAIAEKTGHYLNQVLRAAQRAKDLTHQILTFSHQRESEDLPTNIALIAKEALKLLRASIPANIAFEQQIDTQAGIVLADPTQVHQVIMNLCANAACAMQASGGVLGVRLAAAQFDAVVEARCNSIEAGRYLRLSVSDTGEGIPAGIMDKIFDPYFTTKKLGEGTGMGLAVVHGIVQKLGGAIQVTSAPGQGACFDIYFPASENTASPAVEPCESLPTGTATILLVDDEGPILEINSESLTRLGYRVVALDSALAALAAVQADPAAYDLVITDQTMPNLLGIELAEKIGAIAPGLPVILCTGFSALVTPAKAAAKGVRALLNKPVLKRELALAVRQVLDQRRPIG
jgi:two-component system NtrC family sensor kinase